MSVLRSRLFQAVVILALAFCIFRFGIRPPAPWSVIQLYMSVVLMAVLIYVSADSDSWRAFVRPIRSTLVDPDKRRVRLAFTIVDTGLQNFPRSRQPRRWDFDAEDVAERAPDTATAAPELPRGDEPDFDFKKRRFN